MKPTKIKLRKCKSCQTKFEPLRPLQSVCSPKCSYTYQALLKSNKKAKEMREETKIMKDKLITISEWKNLLQIPINTIIRLIDEGQPCIATGSTTGKRNAGHYISRGANDTIRFHLDNIHIQSEHSNSFNGGDTLRYQDGIKRIYGKEYFEFLETLKSIKPIKLSIEEIKEKILIAKSIVKDLKENNSTYDAETRLTLRAYYNELLGIYK